MRFFSLTAISMAGLAHARLSGLQPRMPSQEEECCPCPIDGDPNAPVTVTVTEPATTVYAPEKTVTVDNTFIHPAETVYISEEPETVPTPKPVTKEIPKKEEDEVVTKTIHPEPEQSPDMPEEHPQDDEPELAGPKTVTIHPSQESPVAPEVVTVTEVPEHSAPEPTAEDTHDQPQIITKTLAPKPEHEIKTVVEEPVKTHDTETKTIVEEPAVETHAIETKPIKEEPAAETHEPETVVVSHEPSIKTVTEGGSITSKTVQIPHTVTVAPNPEVVTQIKDHMSTVTETVTDSHGNIDIEIIIININTGDKTCHMKDSGNPCPSDDEKTTSVVTRETTVCTVVEPSTSIETTFNTVTVTVDDNYSIKPNGTASLGIAQSTGTMTPRSRKPRGPLPQQRWW